MFFASSAAPWHAFNALSASCMQCLRCCCGRCVSLARVSPWRLLLRPVPPLLNAAWHHRQRHLLAGSGLSAALAPAGLMRSAQWYFNICLSFLHYPEVYTCGLIRAFKFIGLLSSRFLNRRQDVNCRCNKLSTET